MGRLSFVSRLPWESLGKFFPRIVPDNTQYLITAILTGAKVEARVVSAMLISGVSVLICFTLSRGEWDDFRYLGT